jgi:hypothetical protein
MFTLFALTGVIYAQDFEIT